MKKIVIAGLAVSLALVLSACGGTPSGQAGFQLFPDRIQNFLDNPPNDVIYAVGTARMSTQNMSMTHAEGRALMALARTMDVAAQGMIRDYHGTNELTGDAQAFAENISVILTQAQFSGARVQIWDGRPDGTVYALMVLNVGDAGRAINQATATHNLQAPFHSSLDAEARMQALISQRGANAGIPLQVEGD